MTWQDALTNGLIALVISSGLTVGVWVWAPTCARACLHPDAHSTDPSVTRVEQSEQTALAYFDGKRQHLFLSTGVANQGELSGLGWVIPVPETPEEYGTADSELFEKLGSWMNLRWVEYRSPTQGVAKSASGRDRDRPKLEVLSTIRTGPYEITPLKATGRAGLEALKKWFDEHGIRAPDSTKPARYYVERDWTFLAIRISPEEGAETLDLDGELRPLYLTFESDRIVYPLKFETNQGEFSVTLHVVTNRRISDSAFSGARSKGFWVAGHYGPGHPSRGDSETAGRDALQPDEKTAGVRNWDDGEYTVDRGTVPKDSAPEPLVESLDEVGAWDGRDELAIRTLYLSTFNSGPAKPEEWSEDLAIPGVRSPETLTEALAPPPVRRAADRASQSIDGALEGAKAELENIRQKRRDRRQNWIIGGVVGGLALIVGIATLWAMVRGRKLPEEYRKE